MAIRGSLKTEALNDAGLTKGTRINNWNDVLKSSVSYVLSKWTSGKSAYEKALTNDATSGLDQIPYTYWRTAIKKEGSFAIINDGVAKKMVIHGGKSYLFDVSNGTEKTDYENLQVAIAAKAGNIISSARKSKASVKSKPLLERKVTAAVTTSANKASAAIANLNS